MADIAVESLKARIRAHRDALVATVESVSGEVTCVHAGDRDDAEWSVETGLRLARGTTVRVVRGRVLIRFEDGSDVWLRDGSALTIGDWTPKARNCFLREGRLLTFVAPAPTRPFRIETPSGNVAVAGTAFELVAGPGRFSVAVVHGGVEASRDGQRWMLRRRDGLMLTPAGEAVRFDARESVRERWADALAESAANERVSEAFRAFSSWAAKRADEAPRRGRRVAAWGALLAAIVAGAWYSMQTPPGGGGPAGPNSGPGGPTIVTGGDPPPKDGSGKPVVVHRFQRRIVKPNGDVVVEEGGGPMPDSGDLPPGAVALHDAMGDINAHAQIRSGMHSVNDLIAQGVPPDEARRRVAEGMAASLKKQIEGQTGQPAPDVQVFYGGDGDRAKMGVGIQIGGPETGGGAGVEFRAEDEEAGK